MAKFGSKKDMITSDPSDVSVVFEVDDILGFLAVISGCGFHAKGSILG